MKIYLDTSVIGGYHDDEFKEETRKLFNDFKTGKHIPVISSITIKEIYNGAPPTVVELLDLLNSYGATYYFVNEKASELAAKYLSDNIVTNNYRDDALHIALATVNEVDVLVSWNFKHIVNYSKIERFNRINKLLHYKELEIRSPKEFYYG